VAAADVEWDDDTISDGDVPHLRPGLLDDSHGLVAEDVALAHEGAHHFVEMEVGAADSGGRDPDDHVLRLADVRIGNVLDPDIALAVPGESAHEASSPPLG
jgi:hypothetical protein